MWQLAPSAEHSSAPAITFCVTDRAVSSIRSILRELRSRRESAREIFARLFRSAVRSCECQNPSRHPTGLKSGTNLVRDVGIAIELGRKRMRTRQLQD